MKIENISSVKMPMPVSFMTSAGKTINVNLSQGEFIYTDSDVETKSIIIQAKKGNIKTYTEEKPDNLQYFEVYGQGHVLNNLLEGKRDLAIAKPMNRVVEEKDLALEKYQGQFKIPTKAPTSKSPSIVVNAELDVYSDKNLFPDKVNKANEILQGIDIPITKNKGGRPKGSKDTVKRGEPKLKKPAGRPINTETLVGLTVEEVTDKCHARGYTIRRTQVDGVNYIGTCDVRPDRVNIVIEKGKVIRAGIG